MVLVVRGCSVLLSTDLSALNTNADGFYPTLLSPTITWTGFEPFVSHVLQSRVQ
jgi:hypothetical protein